METVQTVKCGCESPTQAAYGAAVVQIAKVRFVRNDEMSSQTPNMSCRVTTLQYVTPSPDGASA